MRAVADNPALAASSGINVERVISVVWIGGAALAGLSGCAARTHPGLRLPDRVQDPAARVRRRHAGRARHDLGSHPGQLHHRHLHRGVDLVHHRGAQVRRCPRGADRRPAVSVRKACSAEPSAWAEGGDRHGLARHLHAVAPAGPRAHSDRLLPGSDRAERALRLHRVCSTSDRPASWPWPATRSPRASRPGACRSGSASWSVCSSPSCSRCCSVSRRCGCAPTTWRS